MNRTHTASVTRGVEGVDAALRHLALEQPDVVGGVYLEGVFTSRDELIDTAANAIARMTRGVLDPHKIVKRDVAAIMAAYGLGQKPIKDYSFMIAKRLRREYGYVNFGTRA